ncbi:MAG TPA: hypothetical protein VK494_06910 [Gemmatimonadaceae bacterium]|nr:hypothetical protein [Gemmatimonadaceae bacterium]
MTAPSTSPEIVAPTFTAVAPEQLSFPLSWLLEHASAPIKYRAMTDVARTTDVAAGDIDWLPYSHRPAIRLAVTQARDGTWNRSILSLPSRHSTDFTNIGAIPAVRRLAEYGWGADSPPLVLARRLLFRLLAEDNDPAFTFELATKARDDDLVRRTRGIFREAAAATLAQMGYENDPRLRGAARRILERTVTYLNSPLGEKPWMRVGNAHVLAPESAPPSIYTLTMLAYMPIFRHEHFSGVERIYDWITQPLPRQEAVQLFGKKMVPQPHLIMGDVLPHRNAVEADVPFALLWLETMARLNFLRRNDGWTKLFDRFIDDRDRNGVWHPHKGMDRPITTHPWAWSTFPLDDGVGQESKWTDVTFRIGLIGKLLGREIELI